MDAQTALKPWLAHYPAGVPADIDAASLGTLVDVFNESVAKFGDHPALESFGKRINYTEFGELAQALGSGLQRMGLKKGDRVAIFGTTLASGEIVAKEVLLDTGAPTAAPKHDQAHKH